MIRKLAAAATALLFACSAFAANLNVRAFHRVIDPRNVISMDRLTWYAGESIEYIVRLRRGSEALALPANATVVWQVIQGDIAYLVEQGEITDAGHAAWHTPASRTALPPGKYTSWATAYQGDDYLGIIDRFEVEVRWRPGTDMIPIEPLANWQDWVMQHLCQAVAPLASTQQLAQAIADFATRDYVDGSVADATAPLASTQALASAIADAKAYADSQASEALSAATDYADAAVAPLASTQQLAQAIADFATRDYVDGSVADATASAAVAVVESNLTAHAADTENPHGVTAEQIGALTAEAAVLRSIATVPASDAYSAAASESLPYVVTNSGALTLSGLTAGSIGIRLTTTNASGVALYAAVVKDGDGETLATINPSCDGTEQSARWPWNASETLTVEAFGIASLAGEAESAIITAVQVETWKDVSLVGRTNDLADQHLYVVYPSATNEAANRAYADDAADAALALALGEIATATFNRDLAGYVQRWNPRFDTVAASNSMSTLYGGSTALRLDGEGAAVVPEIRAFAVEAGEVATLTVWSYSGGASNLVPEVTTNLITGAWEQKPESIVSATNIDAFTAQVVFTNDFERLLYVRLVDVSGGSGVPVLRVFGGIAFGDGEAITDWPQGTILGATINGPHTVATNDGILEFTVASGGTGWTNLAFSGTGNAITGAIASGTTLTLERGTIEGGGTGAFAGLPSILVSADWTWTNSIYAVGADTSSTNVAITLPDAGTNFASVVIRKFSNLNNLTIIRGTNVVYTLYDDGSTRSYDWWPQRTNWYWRN